jgi:hypothetical protein
MHESVTIYTAVVYFVKHFMGFRPGGGRRMWKKKYQESFVDKNYQGE